MLVVKFTFPSIGSLLVQSTVKSFSPIFPAVLPFNQINKSSIALLELLKKSFENVIPYLLSIASITRLIFIAGFNSL